MLVAERKDLILWMKVKERFCFWSCISLLIYANFFGHCHVTFPYMELLSHFRRFVQKVIVSCLSDSFVQKTTQQPDGSCNVKSYAQLLYKFFKKQLLYFCKHIWKKYCEWIKLFCPPRRENVFLPLCRYHIILIGNIRGLLQKLDAFPFNYQYVNCLLTLFKYHFSGKIVVKSGQLFDNLQRAVHFNQQEEWTECPASRKRDSWGKSTKNFCWAPSEKPNRRKLVNQCLQTELNKLKRLNLN